ncbi:hypothetical protein C7S17_6766 [Burkholderia thailandensis]|nr:hypothetical protein [Burkholderia thailandensis]
MAAPFWNPACRKKTAGARSAGCPTFVERRRTYWIFSAPF